MGAAAQALAESKQALKALATIDEDPASQQEPEPELFPKPLHARVFNAQSTDTSLSQPMDLDDDECKLPSTLYRGRAELALIECIITKFCSCAQLCRSISAAAATSRSLRWPP
jgi:hypothetical protein